MFKNIWNALFSRTSPEQTIPLKQDNAEEKLSTVENSLLNEEEPANKDQPDDYVEVEETKDAEKVLEPIEEAERETSTDTDRDRISSKQNVFWP
jgi:hypothetical protein